METELKLATERMEFLRADDLARQLVGTLRREVGLRQGLERCLPFREALGEVLTKNSLD